MGSVIQMSAAGTGGTESALVSIDIPQNGSILGVQWACSCLLNADAEVFEAQLSFGSANSNTNDSRQVISSLRMTASLVTAAGAVPVFANYYCPLPDLPVAAGERLFIHAAATAGVTSTIRCFLHLSFDEPSTRVRRG